MTLITNLGIQQYTGTLESVHDLLWKTFTYLLTVSTWKILCAIGLYLGAKHQRYVPALGTIYKYHRWQPILYQHDEREAHTELTGDQQEEHDYHAIKNTSEQDQ